MLGALAWAGCATVHPAGRLGGDATTETGIRVTAEGRAASAPDEAHLSLGVFSEAATADEATRANAATQARILAALKPAVGTGGQISTQNFQLFPITPEGKPIRFQVRNTVEVRVRDLVRVGPLIDLAVKNGANEVQSLTFGLQDPTRARQAALVDATTRARAEADTIAQALGLKITGIVAVSDEAVPAVIPMRSVAFAMADKRMAAPTPIESGSVDVTAQVTVIFDVAKR